MVKIMRKGLTHSEAGKLGHLASEGTHRDLNLKRVEEYQLNPSLCTHGGCKKPLPYKKRKNKFCNQSCSASHNNRGVRRHGSALNRCNNGGCKNLAKKYCSNKCQRAKEWNDRKGIIAAGGIKSLDINPANQDRNLKKYLIEECGNKCDLCACSPTKENPIQIDHIDGNPQNQSLSNVRLLCLNCHIQTPTYGRGGSGRPWRSP